MNTPILGLVKGGKFTPDSPSDFRNAFIRHEGRRVVVNVKRWQPIRSTGKDGGPDANGYYWGVIVHFWNEALGFRDPKMTHETLKTAFNYKPVLVGDEVIRIPLTTVMDSGPFAEYCDKCREGFKDTFPPGEIPAPDNPVSIQMIEEYNALGNARERMD